MELHTIFFREKCQRNEADNCFFAPFPSVNPSVIIFFITDGQKLTDKKFIDRAFPSVISLVN